MLNRARKCLISLASIFVPLGGHANDQAFLEAVIGQEANEINRYLNSIAGRTSFHGVVFIKMGDQILLSQGYGDARQAGPDRAPIPNTPATLFHIGSITKQFTAAAVMKLVEDGKVVIGGKVNDYLPDEYRSTLWGDVTVRQLLSHTSGLGNYLDAPDYLIKCQNPDFNVDSILKEAMQQNTLPWPVGEFHYSNTGYLLLGAVIEKMSGKRYGEFMREFFAKAGMPETGVHDDTFVLGPDMAIGYRVEESGQRLEEDLSEDLARTCGADGNVYSSVYDLSRWNDILDCEENILKPESLNEMTTPVENGYGYGIMTGKIFGRTKIFHSGRVPGFACSFYKFPREGNLESLFIAVLGNNGSFSSRDVANYIAQFLFTGESHSN